MLVWVINWLRPVLKIFAKVVISNVFVKLIESKNPEVDREVSFALLHGTSGCLLPLNFDDKYLSEDHRSTFSILIYKADLDGVVIIPAVHDSFDIIDVLNPVIV